MTAEAGALASLGPATTGSIRPIYTAVNATAARAALDEMTAEWGQKYAAIIRLWHNAWAAFCSLRYVCAGGYQLFQWRTWSTGGLHAGLNSVPLV
jgi:hypothetical protein